MMRMMFRAGLAAIVLTQALEIPDIALGLRSDADERAGGSRRKRQAKSAKAARKAKRQGGRR